ncbi:asparagine synthetase [glutamine-hydrolyzing] 2 [Methylocystis bryophila]|nr:asparagine synthetase [glutamine-hydrolyzing] 2 [Methylocystis bryophila]
MSHRGPDDEQIYIHANVGLCFRRLSIVDLQGGQQPLFDEKRSVVTMCNGEIYNHKELRTRLLPNSRFRTHSDCEVIPYLYARMGMDFLSELNGIFAFVLLDKERNKIYLGRDRLGVKPLYYYFDDNLLVFGSEVKTVLAHPTVPKEFDWEAALTLRSRMRYPHREYGLTSFFTGVHHLPAGQFLEIELSTGRRREHVYWDAASACDRRPEADLDRERYVSDYRELLQDSVEMQLMADVECGVFLSGGIDSVAVAHFAAKHKAVHAFSVLSQSTLGNGDAPSAYAAAQSLGIPIHMALFDWRKLDVDPALWRTMLWMVETPIADAEQYYKYLLHAFARARVPGLKVMLLGSGSDEFNGGYTRSFYNAVHDPSWRKFEQILEGYERESLLRRSGAWNKYAILQAGGRPLISRSFLAELAGLTPYETPWAGYTDMHRRVLQMWVLWHEDRTSAANAIEARVPFLDHRLVELTYAVPPQLREELFWDKTILREAMRNELAEQFRHRPKTPFFQGDDLKYTRRLLYNLLCAKNHALIEEAIDAAPGFVEVVDKDALWRFVHDLPNDPEYSNVDLALDLVNMGLLAAMAKAPEEAPDSWSGDLPVSEAIIGDWPTWEQNFGVSLVQRTPSLERSSVLRFADGISVLRKEAGDPKAGRSDAYCILRNDVLEFTLDAKLEPWVRFLRQVDGAKSVEETIRAADVTEAEIWKHLEEAVEYKVLQVSSGGALTSARPSG